MQQQDSFQPSPIQFPLPGQQTGQHRRHVANRAPQKLQYATNARSFSRQLSILSADGYSTLVHPRLYPL